MTLDPYALCPCGSGKKLKFCCSDVAADIDKIHRMIEGDQPRAALRHVEHTLASHPNRASLLDLKASLELSLGELEAAEQTTASFLSVHPESPNALACQAILLTEKEQALEAAASLQLALSHVDRSIPERVFEAIGAVGAEMLKAGHVVAGQAYLWLHASVAPTDDIRAFRAIVGMNHYSGLPLILRDRLNFRPWPKNAPWKAEAERATELADSGKWLQAVNIIDRLGSSYGAEPSLLFNRALLGGWLGDTRALVAGLHAFAQLDVPLDDAVEAEAVAQLLDVELKEPLVDTVRRACVVHDEDTLVSRLASSSFVQRVNLAAENQLDAADQPPPRHAFVLFDRELLKSAENLTRDLVPRAVGMMWLFGRQTDRAERLELTVDKGPDFDRTLQLLTGICGDALGDLVEETVVGSKSQVEMALNWRWQFPPGTPRDVRQRILDEERRAAVVERWPALPHPALGGRTPREAAGDPSSRIPLLAAVLLLEHGNNSDRDSEFIAELRRELGLPKPEPIDPDSESTSQLPLVRVPRLNLEAVSDDDLVQLYRRSRLTDAQVACAWICREAVRRPSVSERIPVDEAYQRMIVAERNTERALALISEARERSRSAGETTAPWDLDELQLYVAAGDAERAQELLQQIQRDHSDDPNVAAALYQMLYEMGAIRQGAPAVPSDDEAPLVAVGSEAEPSSSRIWTPESDRPAGSKSTLWTPS